jgi:hypothetical protein
MASNCSSNSDNETLPVNSDYVSASVKREIERLKSDNGDLERRKERYKKAYQKAMERVEQLTLENHSLVASKDELAALKAEHGETSATLEALGEVSRADKKELDRLRELEKELERTRSANQHLSESIRHIGQASSLYWFVGLYLVRFLFLAPILAAILGWYLFSSAPNLRPDPQPFFLEEMLANLSRLFNYTVPTRHNATPIITGII